MLHYSYGHGVTPWGWWRPGVSDRWNLVHYYTMEDLDMKKRMTTETSGECPPHFAAVESSLFASLHSIVAHLAVTRYDDGTARQPGTLMIRTVGASWQVTLKEPDVAAQLVIVAPTLDDALAAASLALESDDTPWQPDPWARVAGRTGGKKRT